MNGLSFVVCTHNGAARLPRTLAHLAAQQGLDPAGWEVVLVDNASTDETPGVAAAAWERGGAAAPLRIVPEPQPGLIHARRTGIAAARFPVVSFIDDDNWICPDWGVRALALLDAEPGVGMLGGCGEAAFEDAAQAPDWFGRYQRSYAVGPQAAASGPLHGARATLYGAGLTVRRSALQRLFGRGFSPLLTGRQGNFLSAGDDSELCFALRADGWGMWYDDRLRFQHHMPQGRLTESYLQRMYAGFGFASPKLDVYLMVQRFGGRPPGQVARLVLAGQRLRGRLALAKSRARGWRGDRLGAAVSAAYTRARLEAIDLILPELDGLIVRATSWRSLAAGGPA